MTKYIVFTQTTRTLFKVPDDFDEDNIEDISRYETDLSIKYVDGSSELIEAYATEGDDEDEWEIEEA